MSYFVEAIRAAVDLRRAQLHQMKQVLLKPATVQILPTSAHGFVGVRRCGKEVETRFHEPSNFDKVYRLDGPESEPASGFPCFGVC
jgi:hypothetical protein